MPTYHSHIEGLVQGVGFRPHIVALANRLGICGTVANTSKGLDIYFNASEEAAVSFYNNILSSPPPNAKITGSSLAQCDDDIYNSFSIIQGHSGDSGSLLSSPDLAVCDTCLETLFNPTDRRYRYAFTTCLNCGPRYSIVRSFPYDRERTTMSHLSACDVCDTEYKTDHNIRQHSQTNSCKECAIPMHLHLPGGQNISEPESIYQEIYTALDDNKIIAVKGIGGYLLICNAADEQTVNILRERKARPGKPFAIMVKDLDAAYAIAEINAVEAAAIKSKECPIVVCSAKAEIFTRIAFQQIAPGLNSIGIMLPSTPLLAIIANDYNKPLIVTSANVGAATIVYSDDDALRELPALADYILTFDREIVTPQDDSVIRFSSRNHQRIILRRSRGFAPNYFPGKTFTTQNILACGADMKSAFALVNDKYVHVSQSLGNLTSFEAQQNYENTYKHLSQLVGIVPDVVLIDKHPGYYSSEIGTRIASARNIPVVAIQHHKAHATAVLAENDLLDLKEPVLCVVWDGTGLGDDNAIWGGEFFKYRAHTLERSYHWKYFAQLLGDKMSKEPRLSALSVANAIDDNNLKKIVSRYFTSNESGYYNKLLQAGQEIKTSSTGRVIDAMAAILGILFKHTYEGEAAMKLEALAKTYKGCLVDFYPVEYYGKEININKILKGIAKDKTAGHELAYIARKIIYSLAKVIEHVVDTMGVRKVACSGGVFQNELLVDDIINVLTGKCDVYFHQSLSPNDECISFGQAMYYSAGIDLRQEQDALMFDLETAEPIFNY